ncbi:sphingosine-1-phosphate phosphatase 2-like [Maniola hyperantus]|uniref:sphingosine-1-phosphate phosphatase 2-like n=1 Tax=Aphantopus hyperantus TaxID=2795564 RepID=UPI0015699FBD|nr:sphingosine-1-phosphate phosphatase 1-like isoform X1 [Maniola hyperantus]XP_034826913.1 sphingosine-1-phosphate phosphatase 1-like isoform X2 [Maniola hyperantus]
MWDNMIEYLKDPLLVVKVQNFFGVIYKKASQNEEASIIYSDRHDREDFDIRQHKRIPSDISGTSSSSCETDTSGESPDEVVCLISNRFWYYLFVLGTALGDEIFYATFIPFWFWNIDGAVGRRVVLVWTVVMYIGQGFKDIIRWPRPGYPVKKLQQKWAIEYGMPSTHAMVGVSIPFSVLLYTMDRYQYPMQWGLLIAVAWCTLICVSRVYLGMHSVLDIAAGLLLSSLLLVVLIPAVDKLDGFLLTSHWSPLLVVSISILAIVYHPQSDKWTPTRGDTTMIVSVCAGILTGAWTNYQLGHMVASSADPPYTIIWPSVEMFGTSLLRTILGFCGVLATRAIAKSVSYAFVCALLGRDKNELRNSENSLDNKNKIIVECSYKYFTYGLIGFNTTYVFPNVFELLFINRPTYYTEI